MVECSPCESMVMSLIQVVVCSFELIFFSPYTSPTSKNDERLNEFINNIRTRTSHNHAHA